MNPTDALQALHDSEINFTLQSFYDGCWTGKLDDDTNGYLWEATYPTMQAAIDGLAAAAQTIYPGSVFAATANRAQSGSAS